MFRALAVRNYRLYAAGQLVSNTGTWMARVTQDWLVYHLLTHDNSFALGAVTALQFLPTLFFGMHGGLIADRYPKRTVLVGTQSAMAALTLASGVLIATHTISLWSISIIVFVFGVASALDLPVRQAFVVEMVGRDLVQNAVSLNSATFNGARLLGPAVAGILIEAFGAAPAFFVNAASYLVVIGALLAMRAEELRVAPRVARRAGQLREGFRYVAAHPEVLLPIALIGLVGTFGLNFQITNALMARGAFHRGAGAYGLLSTTQAVGAILGALLSARRRRRPRLRLLFLLAGSFSVLEAASGFLPSYPAFAAMLVPIGAAAIAFATSCNSSVQLGAKPAMQGRAMALYVTVFTGGAPVGALLVGWLGGAVGPRMTLVIQGVLCLVSAAAIGFGYAHRRGLALPAIVRPRRRRGLSQAEVAQPTLADVSTR
ncbi:MAG: MFS transporter [Acidothermus sp.]|nr:MFS transporter [Acidothermus sp.]MCL6538575.1 MFS transporter [Acidothermus sp.]